MNKLVFIKRFLQNRINTIDIHGIIITKGEIKVANIEEINDSNFQHLVLDSKSLVVVDFWAQWCGPCRKLAPVMEQIQNEFIDSIKVYKIDADKNINSAKEYGVISLPSILVFKDGIVKETMVGLMPKSAIVSNIKKYL